MTEDGIQRAPKSGETEPQQAGGPQPDWGPPPTRISTAALAPPPPPSPPSSPSPPLVGQQPEKPLERGSSPKAPVAPKKQANPKEQLQLPPISPWIVVLTVLAAFLINLGLQSNLGSWSTLVATVCIVAIVLSRPNRRQLSVLVPMTVAVSAAALVAVRSSPWVTVPAFAVLTLGLAMASQDRLLARSAVVGTALNYWADTVSSVRRFLRLIEGNANSTGTFRVLRGIGLAAAAVVPLTWLLASADPVFAEVLVLGGGQRFWIHLATTVCIIPAIAGLVYSSHRQRQTEGSTDGATPPPVRAGSMVEGSIVLASVAVLLGVWGLTQVLVALGGAERLLTAANLTAAQNARQGFFQLVAVAALLVGLLVGVDRYVERPDARSRLQFLGLTTLIGLETIGLAAATYSRLALYTQGFGHTMLRTSVAWFLAWLVAVMIVVVAMINRWSKPSGLRSGPLFLLAGFWVLAFGLSNPEASVASGNILRASQPEATTQLDTYYLTDGLGPDAIPTMVELSDSLDLEPRRALTAQLCQTRQRLDRPGIIGWNRSLGQAHEAMASLDCSQELLDP